MAPPPDAEDRWVIEKLVSIAEAQSEQMARSVEVQRQMQEVLANIQKVLAPMFERMANQQVDSAKFRVDVIDRMGKSDAKTIQLRDEAVAELKKAMLKIGVLIAVASALGTMGGRLLEILLKI